MRRRNEFLCEFGNEEIVLDNDWDLNDHPIVTTMKTFYFSSTVRKEKGLSLRNKFIF